MNELSQAGMGRLMGPNLDHHALIPEMTVRFAVFQDYEYYRASALGATLAANAATIFAYCAQCLASTFRLM